MRKWKINPQQPYSLILSADARMGPVDYVNDQIWECHLGNGVTGGIEIETSYGLRAKSMRIFPQFTENHRSVITLDQFATPPTINFFSPSLISISFSPFLGIEIFLQIWTPSSQTILGKIEIYNSGVTERKILMDWISMLNPNTGGKSMVPTKIEGVSVLSGNSENISPTLFMTGGATSHSSPYPSLQHQINLLPKLSRKLTWALSSLKDEKSSFIASRKWAAQPWAAKQSEISMVHQKSLQIETDNIDWDIAFSMAKNRAMALLQSPNQYLSELSFVSTRLPDQGYSIRGDGSDYNHDWSGQSPIEAWYFLQFLLPDHVDIAVGILQNFIQSQEESGKIALKTSFLGKAHNLSATPLLGLIAWEIYQVSLDKQFLINIFSNLLDSFYDWFSPNHDKDQDGIPEWQHLLQTGYEENLLFSQWENNSHGIEITTIESPDLCVYLLKEATSLIQIAKEINSLHAINALETHCDILRKSINNAWSEEFSAFRYWDYESHHSRKGELIGEFESNGVFPIDYVFDHAARIVIKVNYKNILSSECEINISGVLADGSLHSEKIISKKFRQINENYHFTCRKLFQEIIQISIEGLKSEFTVQISLVNHHLEDHTQLLPIWAADIDKKKINQLIENKINPLLQYGKPYGISAIPFTNFEDSSSPNHFIWLPINSMILEGLIEYGKKDLAADLFTRIMSGVIENLRKEKSFRNHYHASKKIAVGERNGLIGLPPIGVFLKIIGVKIHSQWKVSLEGENPFDWPATIKFQGLTICKEKGITKIEFPNGKSTTIKDIRPCTIELSNQ